VPEKVTHKALAVVSGVMLTLSGLYLAYGIHQHNDELRDTILAEERTIDATVRDLELYAYSVYRNRLRFLVENNPEIGAAFAARDRERLLAISAPRYAGLRKENVSFHAWDYNLPDGTVFLRVQDPDAHGDNILNTRPILRAVHESRLPAAGYDVGRHGAIYWVAQPVFHGGEYVGATEVGIETGELMEALRERFGAEVAILVHADRWRKAIFVDAGYRSLGDHVLIATEGSTYMSLPDDVIFTEQPDQRITLGRRELIMHNCASLADYRHAPIGSVLVLQDVTDRLASRRVFIAGAAATTLVLLALSFAVLYASFGSLIGRLEASAAEASQARSVAERSRDLLDVSVKERTADLWTANRTLEEQVAELKRMGQQLRESHARLRLVLDSLDAIVYVADMQSHEVLFANRFATEKLGDIVGHPCWQTIQSGQSGPCPFCTNHRLVGADGRPAGVHVWEFHNDGLDRWFVIQERAIRWEDGRLVRLAIATDTTKRHEAEERLRASLREKEVLLKEIHHRVKNNMQIISSLLNLQAQAHGSGQGPQALRDSQARIQAMSLIHEKLYRSGDLSRIDLGDYLGSLVGRLAETYATPGVTVQAAVEGERVLLSLDTAVPCGLIVNELVTNALKHAFPGGRQGRVRVGVARRPEPGGDGSAVELTVSDDGIGLPPGAESAQAGTLGLQLVTMLVGHQLQGSLAVHRDGGTRFVVRFHEVPYAVRT